LLLILGLFITLTLNVSCLGIGIQKVYEPAAKISVFSQYTYTTGALRLWNHVTITNPRQLAQCGLNIHFYLIEARVVS